MGHFADRFHLKKMKPNRLYYFLNTGTVSPFARKYLAEFYCNALRHLPLNIQQFLLSVY